MALKTMLWALHAPLESNRKVVLIALADAANEAGYAFPSRQRIADIARCSVRTVARVLNELEEQGYLRRVARYRQDGSQGASHYWLNLENVPATEWNTGASPFDVPRDTLTGGEDNLSLGGDTTDTPPGHSGVPGGRTTVSHKEVLRTSRTTQMNQGAGAPVKRSSRRPAGSDTPPALPHFDEWWAMYDHKVGRKDAERAYAKALSAITSTALLAATARYMAWRQAMGDRAPIQANPATWLNGERWNDELPTVAGAEPAARSVADRWAGVKRLDV